MVNSQRKKARQSPILEVDEEKLAKKKAKRKARDINNKSVSPKTTNRHHHCNHGHTHTNKAYSKSLRKTTMGGFDSKRRVDFSDVDELMGSEAYVSHAAMSVAAV